jgi:anti-anti-sigma factor
MLTIETKKADGVLCVALEGRLDTVSSRDFGRRMEAELEDANRVVLDVADLEYVSSAGLRILLVIHKRLEAIGGEGVCVRNASNMVLETLEMTGFWGVLKIE